MTANLNAKQTAVVAIIAKQAPALDYGKGENVYTAREVVEAMIEGGVSDSRKGALNTLRSLKGKDVAELIGNSTFIKLTADGEALVAALKPAPAKAKRTKAIKDAEPKKAPAKKAAAKKDDAPKSELSIKIAAAARMIAEGTSLRFEDFAKGDKVATADGKVWIVTQPALDKKTLWCRPVDGGKPIRRGWKGMTKVAS